VAEGDLEMVDVLIRYENFQEPVVLDYPTKERHQQVHSAKQRRAQCVERPRIPWQRQSTRHMRADEIADDEKMSSPPRHRSALFERFIVRADEMLSAFLGLKIGDSPRCLLAAAADAQWPKN